MWTYNQSPRTDELYHHGVLGQKWGVRRYQNADGSLTAQGKKRYGSNEERKEKAKRVAKIVGATAGSVAATTAAVAGTVKGVKRLKGNDKVQEQMFKRGKDDKPSQVEKITRSTDAAVNKASDVANKVIKSNHPKVKQDTSHMSDTELRQKVNRLQLERQYSDLMYDPNNVSKGEKYIQNALAIAGGVTTFAASAATIASAIYMVKKGG